MCLVAFALRPGPLDFQFDGSSGEPAVRASVDAVGDTKASGPCRRVETQIDVNVAN
jgi:hypothetical protein